MIIYLLHSILFPLAPPSFNSKFLKMFILNIWLFLFFHSLREFLNVHHAKVATPVKGSTILSIFLTILFLLCSNMINYTIIFKKEYSLFGKGLEHVRFGFQFLFAFTINLLSYLYIYLKLESEFIQKMYKTMIALLLLSFVIYSLMNLKYLIGLNNILSKNRFVEISKFSVFFCCLIVLSSIPLQFYFHIPDIVFISLFFTIFNFQLYKVLNNGFMVYPIIYTANDISKYNVYP